MPAYSFQKQFIAPIESGLKTHTIRGKRRHPPRPGQTFFGYYAMRTKQCRKLFESPITKVFDIEIFRHLSQPNILIDQVPLEWDEMEALAVKDGFRDLEHMMGFWPADRLPFRGDIIHWKPLKEQD